MKVKLIKESNYAKKYIKANKFMTVAKTYLSFIFVDKGVCQSLV